MFSPANRSLWHLARILGTSNASSLYSYRPTTQSSFARIAVLAPISKPTSMSRLIGTLPAQARMAQTASLQAMTSRTPPIPTRRIPPMPVTQTTSPSRSSRLWKLPHAPLYHIQLLHPCPSGMPRQATRRVRAIAVIARVAHHHHQGMAQKGRSRHGMMLDRGYLMAARDQGRQMQTQARW